MFIGTQLTAFNGSDVRRATVAAYLSTEYRVSEPSPLLLTIGRPHQGLVSLLASHNRKYAAVVTACNPYSKRRAKRQNELAQRKLVADLDRQRLPHFQAYGADPNNKWPSEESRLVLGLDLRASAKLGRRFAQNAIVWAAGDGLPLLILLR